MEWINTTSDICRALADSEYVSMYVHVQWHLCACMITLDLIFSLGVGSYFCLLNSSLSARAAAKSHLLFFQGYTNK